MGSEMRLSKLGDTDAPRELGIWTITAGEAPVDTLGDVAGVNLYPTISDGVWDATSSIAFLSLGKTFDSCVFV